MDENSDPHAHVEDSGKTAHRIGTSQLTIPAVSHRADDSDDGEDLTLRPRRTNSNRDSSTTAKHATFSPTDSSISFDESIDLNANAHDFLQTTLNIHARSYPALNLSGRIISATFCLPHNITFTHDEERPWTLDHRAGTSALFDSFAFLSSHQSSWKHLLIGWTGEITQRRSRKHMSALDIIIEKRPPASRHSAPVPVEGETILPPLNPNLKISRANRTKLEQQLMGSQGIRMIPVWLYNTIADDSDLATFKEQTRWRHFSEHELYQLFHYKFPDVISGKERVRIWTDYYRLNKAFVDRILEHYHPGDIVIVHDYHLMLVPAMLRARVGDIKTFFFLHAPFPSYEYFRCLAHRTEIIHGILGADIVAFQSKIYADDFHETCRELADEADTSEFAIDLPTDVPGRRRNVALYVLPIGINNEVIDRLVFQNAAVAEKYDAIKRRYRKYHLIIGRDRMDGAKGIAQKLSSFALLLTNHPEWREKVMLIQIVSPTSIEDKERGSRLIEREISQQVAAINGKFGTFKWTPVRYYTRYLPRDEYFALLRHASIGLITSVRDGMNTTGLEFAVAQRKHQGPLLISEYSGTSALLEGALLINPWDLLGTATAIDYALKMSEKDRNEMYGDITPQLEQGSIQKWTEKILRKLCIHMKIHGASEPRPDLNEEIYDYFENSTRRLFIFDYDGTLTPIVEDPDAAVPSPELYNHLTSLCADKRNTVWIVSGRDQTFLIRHLGTIAGLGFSAEHGSFMKYPHADHWIDLTEKEDLRWQPIVRAAFDAATVQLKGSSVECKRVGITWHYRRAMDARAAMSNARALRRQLQRSVGVDYDVEIMAGKANLEVRPRNINKGEVVRKLIHGFGVGKDKEPDFVMCVGDDTTDEDMFRALRRCDLPMRNIFGIVVGAKSRKTMASWRIDEPQDVVNVIARLTKIGSGEEVTPRPTPKGTPPPMPAVANAEGRGASVEGSGLGARGANL